LPINFDLVSDAPQVKAPVRFSRSSQMVHCLRSEHLYSEKRARDLLFTAIEGVLSDRSDTALIVARLTREATSRARLDAEHGGFDFSNWTMAGRAVTNALLSSGSLLNPDGCPIAPGVAANAAVLGRLRADFRDHSEAYLLEFLLRRLGDVTLRDHTALAHALFRQFDPSIPMHDFEDRVAILAARLAGRIGLDGERYVVHDLDGAASP
jgi:hypothetical protein